MSTAEPTDHLRELLRAVVKALEIGNWRAVLRPPEFGGRSVAGPKHLVQWAVALRLVALSMQLQAQGQLQDAWDRLSEAAKLLPREELARLDVQADTFFAVLRPEPPEAAWPDVKLVVAIARLVWREQSELRDLKHTFAPDRMRAHDELVEAVIQYLFWVESDPSTYCRRPAEPFWDDGVTVDRSRKMLCLRATEIRWFGNPAATVEVSQAPWQDGGAFVGLYTDALDVLAERPEPAPWCGARGASGLVVRRGRLRAWQNARRHKEDLDSFRIPMLE